MRTISFAKRNVKELLRDPMSLIFGILLPLFLLVIFQQFQIPSEIYKIENFAPGIIIFSYSFISLFTGQLVSKDRTTSLLTRLFASPMKALDYVLGYSLALIPMALIQNIIFYTVAIILGMKWSLNIIVSILILIPISILFIAMGILIGCISSEKQAPALGSIVVQLVAFTSGLWFSLEQVGSFFAFLCKILPFSYAVDLARMSLLGIYNNTFLSVVMILAYIIIFYGLTIIIFKKKMISDNK